MKILFRLGLIGAVTTLASVPALAEEAASGKGGLGSIAAAIAIGVAALGGGIGQGMAVASALDGIGRNPAAQNKIFIPMIVGLAFIESLVLYGLLIALKVS